MKCPKCGTEFEPRRQGQRFCRRNCGRWLHHTAIEQRTEVRDPADEREAYLAGLIATDGYIERRKGREAPTGISIKMAAPAAPLLTAIGAHYRRRVYERSNGQVVLNFINVPVIWKLRLPKLAPDFVRHYVRGLLDGDGCISGSRVDGHFYPYVSLAYNPQREPWIGDFYKVFLTAHGLAHTDRLDKPTVRQVRCWSSNAQEVTKLVYDVKGWAHPAKLERARRVWMGMSIADLMATRT